MKTLISTYNFIIIRCNQFLLLWKLARPWLKICRYPTNKKHVQRQWNRSIYGLFWTNLPHSHGAFIADVQHRLAYSQPRKNNWISIYVYSANTLIQTQDFCYNIYFRQLFQKFCSYFLNILYLTLWLEEEYKLQTDICKFEHDQ